MKRKWKTNLRLLFTAFVSIIIMLLLQWNTSLPPQFWTPILSRLIMMTYDNQWTSHTHTPVALLFTSVHNTINQLCFDAFVCIRFTSYIIYLSLLIYASLWLPSSHLVKPTEPQETVTHNILAILIAKSFRLVALHGPSANAARPNNAITNNR